MIEQEERFENNNNHHHHHHLFQACWELPSIVLVINQLD
jgi:hypothetical protein